MGHHVRKNLIYYIYFDGVVNDYHRLNLALLNKYWHLFDGHKIIKVSVNDMSIDLDPLFNLMPELQFWIELVQNNQMGEAVHSYDSLNQVDSGVTFYAHCKGVSRPHMNGLVTWINKLYDENLSKEPNLNGKLFAGICAKLLDCSPYVPYDFHYSGSFYWFDTAKVKERLKDFELNKYFTECFPAIVANMSECQFNYHYTFHNVNYYLEETWQSLDLK